MTIIYLLPDLTVLVIGLLSKVVNETQLIDYRIRLSAPFSQPVRSQGVIKLSSDDIYKKKNVNITYQNLLGNLSVLHLSFSNTSQAYTDPPL